MKEKIFDVLIADYLKNGRPVGSKYLHKVYFKKIPSSTIRWYLRKLTEEKIITNVENNQGRVPTDKGWRLYFEKNRDLPDNITYQILLQTKAYKKNNLEFKFNYILKKFNLYGIIYNNNYWRENGLDCIAKNPEFDDRNYFLKLSYLIKSLKNKKISSLKTITFNDVNILIGKEISIPKCDEFSIFAWKKSYLYYYFLIGVKRINYPIVYKIIKKLFKI
ncbi:MAG: hypothetical protein KatS3mg095_0761 [Candidatus Parcubacteria bacterium]|nr:MAG: hypothetical protein KatS3mg095_0761 [Candidatus Parcubacteria bacterium]